MDYPPGLVKKVERVFGDRGRAWLPRLPDILTRCRRKWDLPPGEPCTRPAMNYIEFTTSADGDPVALKVGVPHTDLYTEMEALRLYDGSGVARLYDTDSELGAILEQRVCPGDPLSSHEDDRQKTQIAASIIRRLVVPEPALHSLPTFRSWVDRAFSLTRTEWDPEERMPRALLDRAEQALEEVLRNGGDPVLLHGDLHHWNILLDDDLGWTVIDPKGVIGPRPLEVGRFLQNRLPEEMSIAERASMVQDRVGIFNQVLGIPERLLLSAGLVDTVLGRCWSLEDEYTGPDWQDGVDLAWTYCNTLDSI